MSRLIKKIERRRAQKELDDYTLTRLRSGRPLVVSDNERGYCFVDPITAERLASRGIAQLDSRPFHEFLWGV